MAIRITYVILLWSMLLVLYLSGESLKKRYKIFSYAGFASILAYTLNEGLRFGRGIDYNLYWRGYDQLAAGWQSKKEPVFIFLQQLFISLDLAYQALVIFMSFMFILGVLCLMRNYKSILPLALPLFVIYSLNNVENMVRWYLAYSFILIGLSFLMQEKHINWKYIFWCAIGCSIHLAIIPIPVLIYILYLKKSVLLHPFISIPAFFLIYFLFDTKIMLNFADLLNVVTSTTGAFENYSNRAEYWLTGGFAGVEMSGKIGPLDLLYICTLTIMGYKAVRMMGRNYIFAYNLFIVGMLLYPISKKIELVGRYDQTFYIFRGIVLATVIYVYFIWKHISAYYIVLISTLLIYISSIRSVIVAPFKTNEKFLLYVWDKGNYKYDSIYQLYIRDLRKSPSKEKRRK